MNQTKKCGRYADCTPYQLAPFGYPIPLFDDAVSVISEEGFFREREMELDGKRFQIRSFFPSEPSANSTEKLLRLIDNDCAVKKK